ncbi:ABC transporter permease [Phytoactinopolyspora halotolerans]|uniref:ABC transporter permease n=1 Tax=Phytoactinopolyspora halotolerans TaxID=1981512 RepID=A0A6L9SAM3_9ACTN|nr:ABC transporter permease [Phytoactinopolyspora halotolerans]NEE01622.1 ABC transporter permease [Phytoactinopolyspora halotolerans]
MTGSELTVAGTPAQGTLRTVWAGIRSSRAATIGLAIVALHVLVAIAAPLLTSYAPTQSVPAEALAGVSWDHLAGTDQYGRDVLTRVLHGGRFALVVCALSTVAAVGLGTVVGCFVALRGGWADNVVMRLVDSVLAVPAILALLVVVTALGTGTWVVVAAITIVYVPGVVRVVRAAAQSVVPLEYVTAARARGERRWSILRRELLPNVADVVAVELAMRASWAALLVSSLSFLGFGANPPTPDWGLMVAENRTALTVVPMATLAPIVALATFVVGLNLAADGLAKAWGIDRFRRDGR